MGDLSSLFLQLLFLKIPGWVSGIFFSLAAKSLSVRVFIFGIDLKNQILAGNNAPLCYQSSKKQALNNRRIGPDSLYHITN